MLVLVVYGQYVVAIYGSSAAPTRDSLLLAVGGLLAALIYNSLVLLVYDLSIYCPVVAHYHALVLPCYGLSIHCPTELHN